MNTRKKIAIDRAIGIVVAVPMNYLVRLVGKLTRFDHTLTKPKYRIVICKFKGMGSIIQSVPLIQSLKVRYTDAEICFVSSSENRAIIEELTMIDRALYVEDKGLVKLLLSSMRLLGRLWKWKPDLYIDLEIYSNYSSIMATCSMATDRFGYYLKSSRYRLGMYTHMMYFNTTAPITEAYLQFGRLLGAERQPFSPLFDMDGEQANHRIVINPNASDLRLERRWPAEQFIALIKQLLQTYPEMEVCLIGSKSETIYVSQIAQVFLGESRVVDLSGKTNLKELIRTIGQARLVITNDTGPMHLATAMQKPTVALFGPCAPEQYAIGQTVIPIYKNIYCSPCVHEFVVPPCRGNNQCMQLIEVGEVLQAVKQLLSSDQTSLPESSKLYDSGENHVFGTVTRNS